MKSMRLAVLAFVVVTVAVSGFAASFSPTGRPNIGRFLDSAVTLADGRVLVVGNPTLNAFMETRTEFFDPATRLWTIGPNDTIPRTQPTVTLLANGKVLIVGGFTSGFPNGSSHHSATASLFDPATNLITATGSLSIGRSSHRATRLADGRVLITGGFHNFGAISVAEIYDPATGTFSNVANPMTEGRYEHEAVLLGNGKVLITGGKNPVNTLATAELFDPALGTFTALPNMAVQREFHTTTLLLDGRVLVAGGYNDDTNVIHTNFQVFDPATNTFPVSGNMISPHGVHAAARLADGRVLIAGGGVPAANTSSREAELFNPATNTFAPTRPLHVTHRVPLYDVLADGRVLIAGGIPDDFASELYDPTDRTPPRGDWNGDGTADVFWSNASSNMEYVWFFDPTGIVMGATKNAPRSGTPTIGDFDGDGINDVIHRDGSGNNIISLMSGYGVRLSYPLPAVPSASWQLAAGADFNGDGTDDLLWVEPATPTTVGHNVIWLMNNGAAIQSSSFNDVPQNWAFAATGDFNADGKADILWRNTVTGENVIWLMDTYVVINGNHIHTVQDPQYSVGGTGDVNGDGKSDIVWQNNASGAISIWIIDGVNSVDGSHIGLAPGFATRQVGDFDADGNADLFLRNAATGENAVWYLDHFNVLSTQSLAAVTDGSVVVPQR